MEQTGQPDAVHASSDFMAALSGSSGGGSGRIGSGCDGRLTGISIDDAGEVGRPTTSTTRFAWAPTPLDVGLGSEEQGGASGGGGDDAGSGVSGRDGPAVWVPPGWRMLDCPATASPHHAGGEVLSFPGGPAAPAGPDVPAGGGASLSVSSLTARRRRTAEECDLVVRDMTYLLMPAPELEPELVPEAGRPAEAWLDPSAGRRVSTPWAKGRKRSGADGIVLEDLP